MVGDWDALVCGACQPSAPISFHSFKGLVQTTIKIILVQPSACIRCLLGLDYFSLLLILTNICFFISILANFFFYFHRRFFRFVDNYMFFSTRIYSTFKLNFVNRSSNSFDRIQYIEIFSLDIVEIVGRL